MSEPLLTAGDVAKVLDLSTAMVRVLAVNGDLRHTRTEGGIRLFKRTDVERLKEKRATTA